MIRKIIPYILIAVIVSVLGFITENIWLIFRYGYVDNRGMTCPALLGYGMAVLLIYYILGLPQNPRFFGIDLCFRKPSSAFVYYNLMTMIIIFIGEIILGNVVEYVCNITWWDYSSLPLHIGKYTSVPTTFAFASIIELFMLKCFEPLMNLGYINQSKPLCIFLFVILNLLFFDFINSACYMIKKHKIMKLWHVEICKKAIGVMHL